MSRTDPRDPTTIAARLTAGERTDALALELGVTRRHVARLGREGGWLPNRGPPATGRRWRVSVTLGDKAADWVRSEAVRLGITPSEVGARAITRATRYSL